MFPFLLLPENLPFLAAIGVVGATAAVEAVLLALGGSLGAILGPDGEPGAEGGPLAWLGLGLGLGKVPLSVLLVLFAGYGFGLQA